MYGWASSTFWGVFDPSKVIPVVLLIGVTLLWSRWPRLGKWIATIGGLAYFIVAVLPVAGWITVPLENRFSASENLPETVDGIILLGGSVSVGLSNSRGHALANQNANRFFRFVTLTRLYPDARLVLTGAGKPRGHPTLLSEVELSIKILEIMGVDLTRVEVEGTSNNTYENAILTLDMVKPAAGETWLLVTSAWHMPRAMGSFRHAGWDPIPVPSGYTTGATAGWSLSFSTGGRLVALSRAAHEWVGLVVYRLLGRTGELFPSSRARLTPAV